MSPARCQRCGATLPPDRQSCARCLLELAVPPAGTQAAPERRRPPPPPPEALAADFPNLEIGALIGEGGMGCVYRARHRQLGRDVALKILAPGLDDPHFEERFLREARAMARLDHPGIVRVHDFGRSAGRWYLTMEFVSGTNLRQLMQEGRITARVALQIIPQLCDALQYAHDQGVVHRDIKPENVLVDGAGRVKVADFGLAKILGKEVEPGLTHQSQVMGTLNYMAPEQMQGARNVDHRADIFSLGVVFYEMLTGQLPVGTFEPPSRHAPVPPGIDAVVSKSLERAPERRYQHAVEVKTDVALCGEVTAAEGEGTPPAPSRQVLAGAAMVSATLLLGVAIGLSIVSGIHYRDVSVASPESLPHEVARAGDRAFYRAIAAVAAIAGGVLGWYLMSFARRCGPVARLRWNVASGLATLVTGATVLVLASLLGNENGLPTETGLVAGTFTLLTGVLVAVTNGASLLFVPRPGAKVRPDRARIAKVAAALVASAALWLAFWVVAYPLGDFGLTVIALAQAAVVWLVLRRPRETTLARTWTARLACASLVMLGACAWSWGTVAGWEQETSRHFAPSALAQAFDFARLEAPALLDEQDEPAHESASGFSFSRRGREETGSETGYALLAALSWLLAGAVSMLQHRRISWHGLVRAGLSVVALQLPPAWLAAQGPAFLGGMPERVREEHRGRTNIPLGKVQLLVQQWTEQQLRTVILTSSQELTSRGQKAIACLMVIDDWSASDSWRFHLLRGPERRYPRVELLLVQSGQEPLTRVAVRTTALPKDATVPRQAARNMVASLISAIGVK